MLYNSQTRSRSRRFFSWIASALLVLAVISQFTYGPAVAAVGAPKAYVGIFKDNVVAVIDTSTNKVLTTIPVPPGPHGMAITSDSSTVYVSSDGDSKVSLIDTTSDTVKSSIEVGKSPHGLALTPDSKLLLVAVFGTSMVIFIDTSTNQITGQVAVANPHNIAISPDGHTAYVASQKAGSTALVQIDLAAKTQTGSIAVNTAPRALNFSPDGKQLYFTLLNVDAVQVADPTTNKVVAQIPVGASPHHTLFTSDGEYGLVVSQTTSELAVIDPVKNTVTATIPVGKMPHWIALTADNKLAYVTGEMSNDVSVVDLEAHKVVATIPVGQAPRKIVIQHGSAAAQTSTGQSTMAATVAMNTASDAYPPCPAVMLSTPAATMAATAASTMSGTQAAPVGMMGTASAQQMQQIKPFSETTGCSLVATLSGANEPAKNTDPKGAGTAQLTISRPATGAGEICFQIQVSNMQLPASMAHIHAGSAGVVSGPVIVPLTAPDATGKSSGCVMEVDRALIQSILTHPSDFYVNVHNPDYPAGAARGQLSAK